MRDGPDFDGDQQRMLEHPLDVAGNVGGNESDTGRPHRDLYDIARPCRRIPQRDNAFGAIAREAVAEQNKTNERDQAEQALVWSLAKLGDQCRSMSAHGNEHMRAEKHDQSDNFDSDTHGAAIMTSDRRLSMTVGCASGPAESEVHAGL